MDSPSTPEERVTWLYDKLIHSKDYSLKQYRIYRRWNTATAIVGALIHLGIIVAGVMGLAKLAAVFGACATAVLSIQSHFQFAKRANVWINSHDEAKRLRDRLQFKPQDVESIFEKFQKMKTGRMADLPEEKAYNPHAHSNEAARAKKDRNPASS
jgi:hypothetical protein